MYKDKALKKKLTESDVKNITQFSNNSTSLKQIDEELERSSSSCKSDEEELNHSRELAEEEGDGSTRKTSKKISNKSLIAVGTDQDKIEGYSEDQDEHEHKLKDLTEEEKGKLNKLKKNFKHIFRQNRTGSIMQMEADAVEVVEAVEDINEMKKKIEKLEDMFKRIMTKVDQIS